jgi:hypothetical protein
MGKGRCVNKNAMSLALQMAMQETLLRNRIWLVNKTSAILQSLGFGYRQAELETPITPSFSLAATINDKLQSKKSNPYIKCLFK